jgi:hypothetical protein
MATKFLVCEHGGGLDTPRLFTITAKDKEQANAWLDQEDHEGTTRTIIPMRELGAYLKDQPSKSIVGWQPAKLPTSFTFLANGFPHTPNLYLLHPEDKSSRSWDTGRYESKDYSVFTGEDLNPISIKVSHKATQKLFTYFLELTTSHRESAILKVRESPLTLFRPHPFKPIFGLYQHQALSSEPAEIFPPTHAFTLLRQIKGWALTQSL